MAWNLSRASGIVATGLLVTALVSGFFFSGRNTGPRRRPAWWLDLHNWLGGLALAMIGVHLVAVYADSGSGIGVAQLLVPGASSFAITSGVIATYLVAIAVFTSWPSKRLGPARWRLVHLGSVGGAALAGLHAYQAGSDASAVALQIGLMAAVGFGLYAALVRLIDLLLPRAPVLQPVRAAGRPRAVGRED